MGVEMSVLLRMNHILSFISFILVACGIVTKQSMIDNLQNNSWTITRNNSASATNIKFLKDGTVLFGDTARKL